MEAAKSRFCSFLLKKKKSTVTVSYYNVPYVKTEAITVSQLNTKEQELKLQLQVCSLILQFLTTRRAVKLYSELAVLLLDM